MHHGIVANPNCVAIPLSIVLAPLQRAYGLRHVTVGDLPGRDAAPASGSPTSWRRRLGMTRQGRRRSRHVYPHVLHGNVVPGGWAMQGDDTEEEVKVIAETRRVLAAPELRMSVTTVRVPVAVGHSAAVWVELDGPADPDDVRSCCAIRPGSLSSTTLPRSDIRCPEQWRAAMTSRWGGSVATPGARTGSRCSSAPTTFARARRPTPCRLRSCCSAIADGPPRESLGHARAVH